MSLANLCSQVEMQCTCFRKPNKFPFYKASLKTVKIHANLMDETPVKVFPPCTPLEPQKFPQANRSKPSGALFSSGEMRSPVARVAELGPWTQPNIPVSIWAAKGGHSSTFDRAATATGQSINSQLSKSLLPCKTNSESTRKGYTWVGKLPSSYIPK